MYAVIFIQKIHILLHVSTIKKKMALQILIKLMFIKTI